MIIKIEKGKEYNYGGADDYDECPQNRYMNINL